MREAERSTVCMEIYPVYLVPDTNCFVDQLPGLMLIMESRVFTLVVPLVVINELDGLKKSIQEEKYGNKGHARSVMENARYVIGLG